VLSDRRDSLRTHLTANGIGSDIHYPVPVHGMPEFAEFTPPGGLPITERACERVLSVPVHGSLKADELDQVVAALNAFTG
jgi:dTDP-4-amino-4,6-dideoxygalactose transaminase